MIQRVALGIYFDTETGQHLYSSAAIFHAALVIEARAKRTRNVVELNADGAASLVGEMLDEVRKARVESGASRDAS